jgi:hypothetical protein
LAVPPTRANHQKLSAVVGFGMTGSGCNVIWVSSTTSTALTM